MYRMYKGLDPNTNQVDIGARTSAMVMQGSIDATTPGSHTHVMPFMMNPAMRKKCSKGGKGSAGGPVETECL